MPPNYITLLELIRNGEPVDARVPNRVFQQLAQRDDYLKAIVDLLSAAKGVFDVDAELSPDVLIGSAVYWNPDTIRYEPALAALDRNNEGIYGNIADSAYCVGVCVSKNSPVRGTVVFSGRVDNVDFSQTISGVVQPGPYFLSSVDPGKMVRQRPPIGILVLFALKDEGYNGASAIVMPTPREILEDHIHYALTLEYGNIVSDVNPGWTAILDPDIAPAEARFRYKEELDPPIHALFPFYPPENVYFDVDGIGANEKVLIDMNGIWWIDTENDPSDYQILKIYYTKMVAKTSDTMVTSLRPFTAGPLSFVDCFGEEAFAGDLYAKLNLILNEGVDNTPGYIVFKTLANSQQFNRGPVVESLSSDSPELSIRILEEEGITNEDGSKAGKLALVFNNPTDLLKEGIPSLISLHNALEEDYNGEIPYIGLPKGFLASVNYRFDLPQTGLSGDYKFYFYCWLFSPITGVFPTLSCSYIRVRKALADQRLNMSGNITGSANLTIPIVSVTTNDYILASLLPATGIVVAPGDQVHVKISRNDSSYNGSVGVLRAFYNLIKG